MNAITAENLRDLKGIITDSIHYWEWRRPVYNGTLALVVVISFVCHLPSSSAGLSWEPIVGLLLAAFIANVLYCAAYVADVFVQLSAYQPAWRRRRWMLLIAGIAFAAALFLFHE
ncbi:MAG: hypothetical protein ACYDH9_01435 [Limisphaerales bacterium]